MQPLEHEQEDKEKLSTTGSGLLPLVVCGS
jgi:hypothetical protein